jgi:hypothetical protein
LGGLRALKDTHGVIIIRSSFKHFLVALCALVAMLAIAAPASAKDCQTGSRVTTDQYGEVVDSIDFGSCAIGGGGDPSDPGTADPGSATDPGTAGLPFTGLDIGLMGVAAVGLVGAGLLLRSRAHGSESA